MYFVLGGIWDGKAGFAWCTLQAFYEYLILLKVEEIQKGFAPEIKIKALDERFGETQEPSALVTSSPSHPEDSSF
jgi:hypothetical protein